MRPEEHEHWQEGRKPVRSVDDPPSVADDQEEAEKCQYEQLVREVVMQQWNGNL